METRPTNTEKKVISLIEHPVKANKFYLTFQFFSKRVYIFLLKDQLKEIWIPKRLVDQTNNILLHV